MHSLEKRDRQQLKQIRESLVNISTVVYGTVSVIGNEHGAGDRFDYDGFSAKSKSYLNRITSAVNAEYKKITSGVQLAQKEVFFSYRKELQDVLKKLKFKPIVEAKGINVVFGGKPNKAFVDQLNNQLKAGYEPASLIVTVSQDHVKLIQKQLLSAVAQGRGYTWATDRVLKEMYPKGIDSDIRAQMEYNLTRIMRTSYMNAVNNDTTSFVFGNQDVFYGSRRTADGRPCIACVALDGTFYKPGQELRDHPNGMCVLVPLPYPDEYFNSGKITSPMNDRFDAPLVEKFYTLSEQEQREIFANQSLYNLWKQEQFDLDKLVSVDGGVLSYRTVSMNLDNMGGISASRVEFLNEMDRRLVLSIDPKDRALSDVVISFEKPIGGPAPTGLDFVSDGTNIAEARISSMSKAKFAALYGEDANIGWYSFNERARNLFLYTRKTITGETYYVVPKNVAAEQFKKKLVSVPNELPSDVVLKQYRSRTVVRTANLSQSGINRTELTYTDDGKKYVYKTASRFVQNETIGEGTAYNFSKALGSDLVPATGAARGESVQAFAEGVEVWDVERAEYMSSLTRTKTSGQLLADYINNTKDGHEWALIDWILSNPDRHSYNFMVKIADNRISRVVLIDNGRILHTADDIFTPARDYLEQQALNGTVRKNMESIMLKLGWDSEITSAVNLPNASYMEGYNELLVKYDKMRKTMVENFIKEFMPAAPEGSNFSSMVGVIRAVERMLALERANWIISQSLLAL